jgi:hypothetical protein
MLRDYAVESTGHIAKLLWELDAVEDSPHTPHMIRFLQEQQDPDTGLFKDPLISREDHVGGEGSHSWEHIWQHHTGVATLALEALGAKPLYPLPKKAHVDLDEVDVRDWVLSLDWEHPYMEAEHWGNALRAYHNKHDLTPGADTTPTIDEAFRVVNEEIINSETGFPGRYDPDTPGQGLGGAFKMLIQAYVPCGREYPHAEAAARSVLATQQENGEFTDGANMCMNWDAMYMLKHLTDDAQLEPLREDVLAAGQKLENRLLNTYRKDDGGFSFFADHCVNVHNSIRVSEPLEESDAMGTWMCADCLRMNGRWQAGEHAALRPGETPGR